MVLDAVVAVLALLHWVEPSALGLGCEFAVDLPFFLVRGRNYIQESSSGKTGPSCFLQNLTVQNIDWLALVTVNKVTPSSTPAFHAF